ncbi:MAG: DUF3298 domain-containing protein [Clostridia bacterium]|nr:DUF3298 domain-containing protein [Clostridia bacterium]
MKRLILCLLALLLSVPAMAEGTDAVPLTFADDLAGVYCYPEGASEAEARYVYRYAYPQIAGNSDIAVMINTTYQLTVTDALGFEVPMLASDVQEGEAQKQVDISYEITCLNDSYLSVAVTKTARSGGELTSHIAAGHVFALTGEKAGTIVSLPYVLGILADDESDEWYKERQTAKADACVRELVWNALQDMDIALWDDLTFEEFEAGFYPEEDFYLNEDGDPVFFLLAGTVAPEEAGIIQVTIAMETLLDEI